MWSLGAAVYLHDKEICHWLEMMIVCRFTFSSSYSPTSSKAKNNPSGERLKVGGQLTELGSVHDWKGTLQRYSLVLMKYAVTQVQDEYHSILAGDNVPCCLSCLWRGVSAP